MTTNKRVQRSTPAKLSGSPKCPRHALCTSSRVNLVDTIAEWEGRTGASECPPQPGSEDTVQHGPKRLFERFLEPPAKRNGSQGRLLQACDCFLCYMLFWRAPADCRQQESLRQAGWAPAVIVLGKVDRARLQDLQRPSSTRQRQDKVRAYRAPRPLYRQAGRKLPCTCLCGEPVQA